MSLTLNKPFGPYVPVEQLAVGGMAEIYLAKVRSGVGFEKYCVLKVIHPQFANDDQFVQMLIDEAKILVGMSHPNITQVFDLGRTGETYYISMEYIQGADLFKLLRNLTARGYQVPVDVAAYIAQEVCAGLDYAHRKSDAAGRPLNIIHRDISPQNILISAEGEVKIVDFGIAKAASRSRQTQAGVIKGKYFYMSPEQASGSMVDQRTDLFSTGIILYEMLTGQMLYLEEDVKKLLQMVRRADILPVANRRRDVPPDLNETVMKALAKKPEHRWQTAHEFQVALSQFVCRRTPECGPQDVVRVMSLAFGENVPPDIVDTDEQSISTKGSDREEPTRRLNLLSRHDAPSDDHSVIFNFSEIRGSDSSNTGELAETTRVAPRRRGSRGSLPDVDDADELESEQTGPTEASFGETDISHDGLRSSSTAEDEAGTGNLTPTTNWADFYSGGPSPTDRLSRPSAQSDDDYDPTTVDDSGEGFAAAMPVAPSPANSVIPDRTVGGRGPAPALTPRMPAPIEQLRRDELQLAELNAGMTRRERVSAWRLSLAAAIGFVVVGIIMAAALLAYFWPQDAGVARLEVVSFPPGAVVLVDGSKVPTATPAAIQLADSTRSYRIELRHVLYEPWRTVVSFTRGEMRKRLIVSLTPRYGRLTVDSVPSGADVYVDDELRGSTPTTLDYLSLAEPVVVELRKRGYRSASQRVEWSGQSIRHVEITLHHSP